MESKYGGQPDSPIETAQEELRFEKKGMQFIVLTAPRQENMMVFIEHNGIRDSIEIKHHQDHGWMYCVRKGKLSTSIMNDPKKGVNIVHETAEKMGKIQSQYREDQIQKKKERAEKDFRSLTDDAKVRISWGTTYKFLYTDDDSTADKAEPMEKMFETLKTAKIEIGEFLERKPDDVDMGDYSITQTWVITFEEFKRLVKAAEDKIEKVEQERKAKEEEVRRKEEEKENAMRPMSKGREKQYKAVVGGVKRISGDEGPDFHCDIEITSPEGNTKTFTARNLFDVGLVINPKHGGLINWDPIKGDWVKETFDKNKGWYNIDLSKEEKEAYWIAQKNVPASLNGIRL